MGEDGQREPRVRVAAVIVRDDRILLVRHAKDGAEYWLLPGGGVHYGESLSEALAREVREETGLEARVGDVVFAHDGIAPDGSRHIVNVYLLAEVTGGALRCGDEPRLAGVRDVPLGELSELDLRPDLREPLLAAAARGFPARAPYLGSLWKEPQPAKEA